ncbi:MAG: hypothetical protein LBP58_01465 [Azoarcus sp.]|jgi:hypothetical protein|nr:hypothetical protein [Azoarcus sp.]
MSAFKVPLLVLGASFYNIDGGPSGTKVFTQQASEGRANVAGMEVVEYSGEASLFDHFKGFNYPLEMLCEVQIVRAAKGKAGMRILSAVPAKASAKAA